MKMFGREFWSHRSADAGARKGARVRAAAAGARGRSAAPLDNETRASHYRWQNGTDRLTVAQERRIRKQSRKALAG